jgi:hypothetical protein
MMNLQTKLNRLIAISPEHWDVPMRVELRPYLEFNRRISCQLRHLVETHSSHTPIPNFGLLSDRITRGK